MELISSSYGDIVTPTYVPNKKASNRFNTSEEHTFIFVRFMRLNRIGYVAAVLSLLWIVKFLSASGLGWLSVNNILPFLFLPFIKAIVRKSQTVLAFFPLPHLSPQSVLTKRK